MDNKERCMIKAKDLQVKGYTQREISEKLGVCERTVRNYLKNPPASRKNSLFNWNMRSLPVSKMKKNCLFL